jgi:outer membrane protein assembly factor BamB
MATMSRRALIQALMAQAAVMRVAAQARAHTKPRPLAKDAVTHDWTSFLGPAHNATSTETRLNRTLPPPLVWEFAKGTSYTSPAVLADRLLYLHRVGDEEVVECMHAETGVRQWTFRYATDFEDR